MTESQLFDHANRVWKYLLREKQQRQAMLARNPHKWNYWQARIAETEQAQKSLLWLKDQLKEHAELDLVQAPLIDEGSNQNANNGY